MNEHPPHLSPLSEQELHDLWMGLKLKWPILYEQYNNPDYSRPDYDEELRNAHGGIAFFVCQRFPDVNFYPEQMDILSDMMNFHSGYLGKVGPGWRAQ